MNSKNLNPNLPPLAPRASYVGVVQDPHLWMNDVQMNPTAVLTQQMNPNAIPNQFQMQNQHLNPNIAMGLPPTSPERSIQNSVEFLKPTAIKHEDIARNVTTAAPKTRGKRMSVAERSALAAQVTAPPKHLGNPPPYQSNPDIHPKKYLVQNTKPYQVPVSHEVLDRGTVRNGPRYGNGSITNFQPTSQDRVSAPTPMPNAMPIALPSALTPILPRPTPRPPPCSVRPASQAPPILHFSPPQMQANGAAQPLPQPSPAAWNCPMQNMPPPGRCMTAAPRMLTPSDIFSFANPQMFLMCQQIQYQQAHSQALLHQNNALQLQVQQQAEENVRLQTQFEENLKVQRQLTQDAQEEAAQNKFLAQNALQLYQTHMSICQNQHAFHTLQLPTIPASLSHLLPLIQNGLIAPLPINQNLMPIGENSTPASVASVPTVPDSLNHLLPVQYSTPASSSSSASPIGINNLHLQHNASTSPPLTAEENLEKRRKLLDDLKRMQKMPIPTDKEGQRKYFNELCRIAFDITQTLPEVLQVLNHLALRNTDIYEIIINFLEASMKQYPKANDMGPTPPMVNEQPRHEDAETVPTPKSSNSSQSENIEVADPVHNVPKDEMVNEAKSVAPLVAEQAQVVVTPAERQYNAQDYADAMILLPSTSQPQPVAPVLQAPMIQKSAEEQAESMIMLMEGAHEENKEKIPGALNAVDLMEE